MIIDNNKIKTIIFDFDDTIYRGSVWGGWGEYIRDFFISVYGMELADKVMTKYNINWSTSGQQIAHCLNNEFGSARDFINYLESNIYNLSAPDLEVLENELFVKLKQRGYALYIVSNSQPKTIKIHLKKFKIDTSLFSGIYSNQFLKEDITKAVIYKKILKQEKIEANEAIVIGDNYQNDILPALALGLLGVHVEALDETRKIIKKLLN